MREIEFRGKISDGRWVYGDLLNYKAGQKTIICEADESMVAPETIGQYIGRKDNKGNKIFEGDIIECKMIFESGSLPHAGEVVFHNRFGAFATKNLGGITLLHNHLLNTLEIIGNIHDNPELLR